MTSEQTLHSCPVAIIGPPPKGSFRWNRRLDNAIIPMAKSDLHFRAVEAFRSSGAESLKSSYGSEMTPGSQTDVDVPVDPIVGRRSHPPNHFFLPVVPTASRFQPPVPSVEEFIPAGRTRSDGPIQDSTISSRQKMIRNRRKSVNPNLSETSSLLGKRSRRNLRSNGEGRRDISSVSAGSEFDSGLGVPPQKRRRIRMRDTGTDAVSIASRTRNRTRRDQDRGREGEGEPPTKNFPSRRSQRQTRTRTRSNPPSNSNTEDTSQKKLPPRSRTRTRMPPPPPLGRPLPQRQRQSQRRGRPSGVRKEKPVRGTRNRRGTRTPTPIRTSSKKKKKKPKKASPVGSQQPVAGHASASTASTRRPRSRAAPQKKSTRKARSSASGRIFKQIGLSDCSRAAVGKLVRKGEIQLDDLAEEISPGLMLPHDSDAEIDPHDPYVIEEKKKAVKNVTRRVYDLVNVLEALLLVERVQKSVIRWRHDVSEMIGMRTRSGSMTSSDSEEDSDGEYYVESSVDEEYVSEEPSPCRSRNRSRNRSGNRDREGSDSESPDLDAYAAMIQKLQTERSTLVRDMASKKAEIRRNRKLLRERAIEDPHILEAFRPLLARNAEIESELPPLILPEQVSRRERHRLRAPFVLLTTPKCVPVDVQFSPNRSEVRFQCGGHADAALAAATAPSADDGGGDDAEKVETRIRDSPFRVFDSDSVMGAVCQRIEEEKKTGQSPGTDFLELVRFCGDTKDSVADD